MAAAVREEVLKEELGDHDRKVARAKDIRERAFRHANVVEDLVMAQLELAQRDPGQVLKAGAAIKMLSLAAGSLERLHDLKKRALGLDRDSVFAEELPELVIRCLTDDEAAEIRRQQEEEDEPGYLLEQDEGDEAGRPNPHDDEVIVESGDDKERSAEPCTPVATDRDGFRLVREPAP